MKEWTSYYHLNMAKFHTHTHFKTRKRAAHRDIIYTYVFKCLCTYVKRLDN